MCDIGRCMAWIVLDLLVVVQCGFSIATHWMEDDPLSCRGMRMLPRASPAHFYHPFPTL